MTDDRKRYRLTSPGGRVSKRRLTSGEAQQFRDNGFQVEEIVTVDLVPNRADQRRQGLHLGNRRMPPRLASRKIGRKKDE